MKRTRMKAVSDKRRKRDAVYPAARHTVWARSEGICEVCHAAPVEQVHHIAGRGGVDPHRLANLLGVCAEDHARIHQNPEWARYKGYMASRHTYRDR